MILYMLDRTDYTMTNSLISGFIVGKDYTSVFNLHESLSELINDEFISTDTIRDTIHYKITSSGEEALSYFENRLPYAIKEDILEYLKAERINVKKSPKSMRTTFTTIRTGTPYSASSKIERKP